MFSVGMTVRCRGQKCTILDASPLVAGETPTYRLRLRVVDGPCGTRKCRCCARPIRSGRKIPPPPLSLDRIGRDARFRLLHEAFQLTSGAAAHGIGCRRPLPHPVPSVSADPGLADAFVAPATDSQRQRRGLGQDGGNRDQPPRIGRSPPG